MTDRQAAIKAGYSPKSAHHSAKANAENCQDYWIEVSKPDRGSFTSFDSEGQSCITLVADKTQRAKVEALNKLPYGKTFFIAVVLPVSRGTQNG